MEVLKLKTQSGDAPKTVAGRTSTFWQRQLTHAPSAKPAPKQSVERASLPKRELDNLLDKAMTYMTLESTLAFLEANAQKFSDEDRCYLAAGLAACEPRYDYSSHRDEKEDKFNLPPLFLGTALALLENMEPAKSAQAQMVIGEKIIEHLSHDGENYLALMALLTKLPKKVGEEVGNFGSKRGYGTFALTLANYSCKIVDDADAAAEVLGKFSEPDKAVIIRKLAAERPGSGALVALMMIDGMADKSLTDSVAAIAIRHVREVFQHGIVKFFCTGRKINDAIFGHGDATEVFDRQYRELPHLVRIASRIPELKDDEGLWSGISREIRTSLVYALEDTERYSWFEKSIINARENAVRAIGHVPAARRAPLIEDAFRASDVGIEAALTLLSGLPKEFQTDELWKTAFKETAGALHLASRENAKGIWHATRFFPENRMLEFLDTVDDIADWRLRWTAIMKRAWLKIKDMFGKLGQD